MADALAEAVKNAEKEILAENAKAGIDTPTEEVVEEEIEEGQDPGDETDTTVDEEEEEIAVDLSDLEKDESQRLYKALRDPVKGIEVLRALAAQAGLLGKNAPETKKEETAAKRAVTEILSEALGKDYAFLADKLGPALEAVFEQQETSLGEKFHKLEADKVEAQTVQAMKELSRLTKGESTKLEARMAELSNEMPPAPGITPEKYIRHLFVLAGGKLPTATNGKTQNERIQRNANDTADRIQGKNSSRETQGDRIPVAKSLDEAIALAQQQIGKGKHTW